MSIAHDFVATLNTKNLDLFDNFISAESYRNHNPFAEDGLENVKATFGMFFRAFPDLQVTLEDDLSLENKVVGRFTYRGIHTGDFMDNPATGHPIEMRSIDIWRVEKGKAVEHWNINTLEFFTQLGALPPTN